MSSINVNNKDTCTLCPVDRSFLPLAPGTKVRYNGSTFTVKDSTPYMAWFQEKGFKVEGASKGSPVSIQVEILDAE